MLAAGFARVADLPGDWWVGHTKARQEKALAWELARAGIGYYLPMVEKVYFSGGRKRRSLIPLFTSYVFFCGGLDERYRALTTDRLCQVLQVKERASFVRELGHIERALQAGAPLEFYPQAAIGHRVRIKSGPFQDVEGIVVRPGPRTRVVLEVSLLGKGATLEVEPSLLEEL